MHGHAAYIAALLAQQEAIRANDADGFRKSLAGIQASIDGIAAVNAKMRERIAVVEKFLEGAKKPASSLESKAG